MEVGRQRRLLSRGSDAHPLARRDALPLPPLRTRPRAVALPIVVEYEPPDDLSPAEVGSLLDERIDTPDIVSTAIDLAVRGYMTIREEETTRLLFLTDKDYRFEKRKPADDALKAHERAFYGGLFASGDSVLLSSLKNNFYSSISWIRSRDLAADARARASSPAIPRRSGSSIAPSRGRRRSFPLFLGVFLLSSGRVRSFLPPEPAVFFLFAGVCVVLTMLAIVLRQRHAGEDREGRPPRPLVPRISGIRDPGGEGPARANVERGPDALRARSALRHGSGMRRRVGRAFRGAPDGAALVVPVDFVRPGSLRLAVSRFRPRPKPALHGLDADVGAAPRAAASGVSFGAGSGSSGFSGGGGGSGGGFGGGGGGSW